MGFLRFRYLALPQLEFSFWRVITLTTSGSKGVIADQIFFLKGDRFVLLLSGLSRAISHQIPFLEGER